MWISTICVTNTFILHNHLNYTIAEKKSSKKSKKPESDKAAKKQQKLKMFH